MGRMGMGKADILAYDIGGSVARNETATAITR
jgi:hypothetical protein